MSFITVTAKIIWLAKPKEVETVTLSNTSEYRDLETCEFCGKCKNCKYDEQIFYYANGLAELNALVNKPHHDGWIINSYSVLN